MFLKLTFGLLAIAVVSNGLVQFSRSTIYDIYDFKDVKEVPLTHCDNGCLIFASTGGQSVTDNSTEYMLNLVVHDNSTGKEQSIYAISKQINQRTSQKIPYDLPSGRYSILNMNKDSKKVRDVAVYVIDRTTARAIDYEIYDVESMSRANVVPKPIITVMGATQFKVTADKGAPNTLTARLTGFDNALDNNSDECTYAHKSQSFDGFEFSVQGPIISLAFGKKNLIAIRADFDWLNHRYLSKPGFISSPGFHGCDKIDDNQVYRQLLFQYSGDFELWSSQPMRATFDVDTHVIEDVVFIDYSTTGTEQRLNGVQKNAQIIIEATQHVIAYGNGQAPPYGFIARHSATLA